MKPILLEFGGLTIASYGVSKGLAMVVGWWLLRLDLIRRRLDREAALPLAVAATLGGFVGAKLYFLAENAGSFELHMLGGSGFTWYGGLIGGAVAVAFVARSQGLQLLPVAAAAAAPLAVAYAIGRLGCLLAGDGTYGAPSDLPWAMSFPDGMVPTLERVHPTPIYEAILALLLAGLLWAARGRLSDRQLVASAAVGMGLSRLSVEFVRRNEEVALGLTQPQLWSVLLILVGIALLARGGGRAGAPIPSGRAG